MSVVHKQFCWWIDICLSLFPSVQDFRVKTCSTARYACRLLSVYEGISTIWCWGKFGRVGSVVASFDITVTWHDPVIWCGDSRVHNDIANFSAYYVEGLALNWDACQQPNFPRSLSLFAVLKFISILWQIRKFYDSRNMCVKLDQLAKSDSVAWRLPENRFDFSYCACVNRHSLCCGPFIW